MFYVPLDCLFLFYLWLVSPARLHFSAGTFGLLDINYKQLTFQIFTPEND
jgi:hypothetical protein